MTLPSYADPQLTVAVLAYGKEGQTMSCVRSIRAHVKVPFRLHLLHNGPAEYPRWMYEMGWLDTLIQMRENEGLGLGTRALMASVFSPYILYVQNDQELYRDLEQVEMDALTERLGTYAGEGRIASISLAGPVGGPGVYSERAHLIQTAVYRDMEHGLPLPAGGAGPWHHLMWREEAIQRFYRDNGYTHLTDWQPLVIDKGSTAERSNPDGSRWLHEPDTKRLWLLDGPVKERYVYPKLSDAEWEEVLTTQHWPAGLIPEQERSSSFTVPQWH